LATLGCKIDLKEGRLTFDAGEHRVEFGLFKDYESYPSSLSCYGCDVVVSDKPFELVAVSPNDPPIFGCEFF